MPKHFDIVHNSEEWYEARAGLATTSSFDKIITPTGKLSSQAEGYTNQIIAELMLGRAIDRNFNTYAMQWGHQHEADAVNLYMFETGHDVIRGGFFTNDSMTLGSSPDAIVVKDGARIGLAEIKCPENPAVHVEFLLQEKINPKYKPQVYGQMIVSGFDWVDWFSYYPDMPSNRIRTHITDDPEYAEAMKEALLGFEQMVKEKIKKIKEIGYAQEIRKKTIFNEGEVNA